jgi:hypothetical protein
MEIEKDREKMKRPRKDEKMKRPEKLKRPEKIKRLRKDSIIFVHPIFCFHRIKFDHKNILEK